MKAKRYVRRRYHPAFGYYIGAEIVTKRETRTIKNNVPGIYGRPDLNSESLELDLPLAMTVAQAQEWYTERVPFAFLGASGKLGFQDADSYQRHGDAQPDWSRVVDCYEQIVKQKQKYC